MAMISISVNVPDSVFCALRRTPSELAHEMPIASAIHWYQRGLISMGRAAEIAGMDRPAFLAELARRKIDVFMVDEDDLAREFERV